MARLFNDASSEYLENTAAVISGVPLTMACWFMSDDDAVLQALMSVCSSTGNERFVVHIDGTAAVNPVTAGVAAAGAVATAASTAGFTANVWGHACGVFVSDTDRRAFFNGANKATNTVSRSVGAVNRTDIGTRLASGVRGSFMSGRIAEVGIWNVALSDQEVASLAGGVHPTRMRPGALVAYWPLWGDESPAPDLHLIGGTRYPMTLSGTTKANHAPVAMSRRFWVVMPENDLSAGRHFVHPGYNARMQELSGRLL